MAPESEAAGATLLEAARHLEEAGDPEGARSAYERAAAQDTDRRAAATAQGPAWHGMAGGTALGTGRRGRSAGRPGGVDRADRVGGDGGAAARAGRRRHSRGTPSADGIPTSGFPTDDAFAETLEMARASRDEDFARALYLLVVEVGGPKWAVRAGLGLGAELARDGQYSQAELCFLPATESGDDEIALMAWRNVSVVRRRRGDLDGAVEALRAALPATAVELAALLEERGDLTGAGDVLERGAAAGDLVCLCHLLVNLLQRQEYAAVAAQAELAVGTGDPETVAMGYWVWGDARKATDDLAGAVDMYRKGIDTGQPIAAMRVDLAEALHALGDVAAAVGQARLAIESGELPTPWPGAAFSSAAGCTRTVTHSRRPRRSPPPHAPNQVRPTSRPTSRPTDRPMGGPTSRPTSWPTSRCRAGPDRPEQLEHPGLPGVRAGEHALAVQVLSPLGPHAGAKARELAELCDDPEAVHLYYELVGSDAFTELGVAERLAESVRRRGRGPSTSG